MRGRATCAGLVWLATRRGKTNRPATRVTVDKLVPATEAVVAESVWAGGSEYAQELAGPLMMSALVGRALQKGCGCNLFVRTVLFLHGSEGMVQIAGVAFILWP